jgi:hemoglobin/transferrin/lactoferrin receptor protein
VKHDSRKLGRGAVQASRVVFAAAAVSASLLATSALSQPATEPAPSAAAAPSGTAAPSVTLPPVVVTATRTEERPIDVPYSTDLVLSRDMVEKGYRSAPDALQELPGVMVQRTSHGQGSPFIRGFSGFRTLLLVDGIRLNNSTFREGPNQYFSTIDAFSVERFEVVRGPSSVLYGSDAIGGTINAITKGPTGYAEGTQHQYTLFNRYATAERSHVGHGDAVVTFGERVGVYAGGSYKEFGDLEGGRDVGRQNNTGYDQWDADFKLEYNLAPNQRLVFAHQQVQQNNVPRTHSTNQGISFEGTAIGTDILRDLDQYRDLTYLQYRADNLGGPIDAIRASLSWQDQYEREDRIRSSGAISESETDVGTLGFWLQLESPTPIGRLTYGVEYYRDNVSSNSSTNAIQGPVGDDATYDLLGIFVQNVIPLGERFELTLGGRFTYARADADSTVDPDTGNKAGINDDWSSVVGSIRGEYFFVPDKLAAFGGVSQGFRAPNLSDLTRLDFARSGELEIPSSDLDPEKYLQYDLGVKGAFDDFSFQLSWFYTDISDLIIRQPTGTLTDDGDTIVSKANGGDGHVQGVELGYSYRFHPDFTLFGAATWQEGELDQFPTAAPVTVREPLSRVAPVTVLTGIRYDDPARKFFVEGTVTFAGDADKLNTGDEADTQRIPPGGTPGYELVNLRAGYRINPNAQVIVAVENLLDEDYRIHGSGSNGAGRNFVVGLELKF